MEESLLKSSKNNDLYDPFASPPDLQKSEDHRKATSVGIDLDQQQQNVNICPCCENVIQKRQIALNNQDDELLFLGVGYPLYYKLSRYFGVIIFIIFIISGSGFYLLVTLNCQQNCVYFFGIPIINLEISAEDSAKLTDLLHMVVSFAIFGSVMYIKSKIRVDIDQLQKKFISPDQYTIMVQNLPENINQQDLIQWSKQNFQAKPVAISFAFNVKQLANAYQKRQELTIKFNKRLIQKDSTEYSVDVSVSSLYDNEIVQLKQKIQALDKLIQLYRQQKVVCHKIGTVFLTYSEQKTVKEILEKYENGLLKQLVNKLLSPFRNPNLLFRSQNVVVSQAPGPREIIWQNLNYSFARSVLAQILFVFTMVAVVYLSFRYQSQIVELAYNLRYQSEKTNEPIAIIQALVMSLIVVLVNSVLRLIIKVFSYIKQYQSYSTYHSAFCFYYSISYIFNTCFMIYIVHSHRQFTQVKPIEQQNILIYDIHLIMLANAFSQPLYKIFDPEMWFRVLKRRYIKNIAKDKNPYTQSYCNQAWEGYQIQIADNYQYIFRILVITVWFAHSAPLGVVFSITGLFLDYWIGKYLLLRVNKRPESISRQIAVPMIVFLQLLPLVYICGVLQFTYKVSSSSNIFQFLYEFLKYGVTILVIMICIVGYIAIYKPNKQTINPIKYQQVQSMFPYNYQTQNPITKFKGQMKYLYGVLKKGTNPDESQIIKQLLTLDFKNNDNYAQNQAAIMRIKRKNIKRLLTLQTSMDYSRQKARHSTSSDTSNKKSQKK